jgi:subtilisin family serine protease
MKTLICLLFVAVVCAFEYAPLLELGDPSRHIPGRYIIVFNENVTEEIRDAHIAKLTSKFYLPDHQILHKYHIGTFIGFSAAITDDLLDLVRQNPDVQYVEHDGEVRTYAGCTLQTGSEWSLDRVAITVPSQDTPLDGDYHYPDGAGAGVTVYVIDTGIHITHTDFGGRASWGFNAVDSNNADCNGHGTHVAGTIGGTVYGVAKKTTLVAVKVLNCAGSGTNAGVIAGVDWANSNRGSKRAVANMSLGGAASTPLDQAVRAAITNGLQFAIAAGNSNTNACNSSPARVGGATGTAVTVGATQLIQKVNGQPGDQRSSYSNYGSCVDVLAPGSTIKSAWYTSNTATNTISGTSMAAPHVAGVMALFAGDAQLTPAQLKAAVINEATSGIVDLSCGTASACTVTPNLFLHNTCNQ